MACLQPVSGSAVAAVAISAHQQLDLLPKTKSNNQKSFFGSLRLVFCSTLVLPKTKSYNKLLRFFSSDFLLWLRHRLALLLLHLLPLLVVGACGPLLLLRFSERGSCPKRMFEWGMSGIFVRIFRIPVPPNGFSFRRFEQGMYVRYPFSYFPNSSAEWCMFFCTLRRESEVLFLYLLNSSYDWSQLLCIWGGHARYFFLIFPCSSDQVTCWLFGLFWLNISCLPSFFFSYLYQLSLPWFFAFLMTCARNFLL